MHIIQWFNWQGNWKTWCNKRGVKKEKIMVRGKGAIDNEGDKGNNG